MSYNSAFRLVFIIASFGLYSPGSADELVSQTEPTVEESITTTLEGSAILRPGTPGVELFGLEFSLPEETTADPRLVTVHCISDEYTPQLSVSADEYSANARLVNVTNAGHADCASLEINLESLQPAAHENQRQENDTPQSVFVSLEYDQLQANGASNEAPGIFIFNPVHGNWAEATAYLPQGREENKVYATLFAERQKIIAGVISVPDALNSAPARTTPETISQSLSNVQPTDGLLAIDGIKPNSKGTFSLQLPLMLRKSVAPGPSFSIVHDPGGSDGVLGRGWDLSISTISIRTPSPIYHQNFETEDYQLDGQDLIALDAEGDDIPPLYKGGPIIERVPGFRVFRPRNNSEGLIIRRYGKGPNDYRWEVWNTKSQVTRLYGGKIASESTMPSGDDNGRLLGKVRDSEGMPRQIIGQWALTQEFNNQAARRGSEYIYNNRSCLAPMPDSEDDCTHAFLIQRIVYNKAFTADGEIDERGETYVDFKWTDRKEGDDVGVARTITDGRLGFLRAQQHWLSKVVVSYNSGKQLNLAPLILAGAESPTSEVSDKDRRWEDYKVAGNFVYAEHSFTLSPGKEPCLNFDRVLSSYTVKANALYDSTVSKPEETNLKEQEFNFNYRGEECDKDVWQADPLDIKNASNTALLSAAFPVAVLANSGFNLLTSRSPLGESVSNELGGSFRVGIGPAGNTSSKITSVGVKFGANFSRARATATLVDVTGDGLSDRVFKNFEHGWQYCAAERASDPPHVVSFGRCGSIEGIREISRSNSRTNSISVDATVPPDAYTGVGFSRSRNRNFTYFIHRDNDGLIDLASSGQVLYGQGETCTGREKTRKCFVRFSPNSALTPPIPDSKQHLIEQITVPADLRDTIDEIKSSLQKLQLEIERLKSGQITVAWEAPFEGEVVVFGGVRILNQERPVEGWGMDLPPEGFNDLAEQARILSSEFLGDCDHWPNSNACLNEGDIDLQRSQVSFPQVLPAQFNLTLARRFRGNSEIESTCLTGTIKEIDITTSDERHPLNINDIARKQINASCRDSVQNSEINRIAVQRGDVLYFTYDVHPHLARQVTPEIEVRYSQLIQTTSDGAGGAFSQINVYQEIEETCVSQNNESECVLTVPARDDASRLSFSLASGFLPSDGNTTIETPQSGSMRPRQLRGDLIVPQNFITDSILFLELVGEQRAEDDDRASSTPVSFLPVFASFNLSNACYKFRGSNNTCRIDLSQLNVTLNNCRIKSLCDEFRTNQRITLAARLRVLALAGVGGEFALTGLNAELSQIIWTEPPHVVTRFDKVDRADATPKSDLQTTLRQPARDVNTYLPLQMGDRDNEYFRILDGNPVVGDQSFANRIALEYGVVNTARDRQMRASCTFRNQVVEKLRRDIPEYILLPFYDDYRKLLRGLEDICEAATKEPSGVNDNFGDENLQLETALSSVLSPKDLTTSLLTLIDRIAQNIQLGQAALIDVPDISRRGYRLPAKANPLDCKIIDALASRGNANLPTAAISGRESECRYRISANFALSSFASIIDPFLKSLHKAFDGEANNNNPAFEIVLRAVNEHKPVTFSELSGSGPEANLDCKEDEEVRNSCVGTYGTIKNFAGKHFPDGNSSAHLLLRGSNIRVARSVAFSNSIMAKGIGATCPSRFTQFYTASTLQLKQDCREVSTGVDDTESIFPIFKDDTAKTEIIFTITEDGRFLGRDRVFEFLARPLDVLKFRVELRPVLQTVDAQTGLPANPESNSDVLIGHFSVVQILNKDEPGEGLSAISFEINKPFGKTPGRYLIPRSPAELIGSEGAFGLNETATTANCGKESPELTGRCRPWGNLEWTELLLGAQYRTYSDFENNSFSRRRDLLRLRPEITVNAKRLFVNPPCIENPATENDCDKTKATGLPRLEDLSQQELRLTQIILSDSRPQSNATIPRSDVLPGLTPANSKNIFLAVETFHRAAQIKMQYNQPLRWVVDRYLPTSTLIDAFRALASDLATTFGDQLTAVVEFDRPPEVRHAEVEARLEPSPVLTAAFIFYETDPKVAKVGGNWSVFGGFSMPGRSRRLSIPDRFLRLRFNRPDPGHMLPLANPDFALADLTVTCSGKDPIDRCEDSFSASAGEVFNGDPQELLTSIDFFALAHRFVGPTTQAVSAENRSDTATVANDASNEIATDPCISVDPGFSSCWQGNDFSVYLQQEIGTGLDAPLPVVSATGFVGLERAAIAQFHEEFEILKDLSCLSPAFNENEICIADQVTDLETKPVQAAEIQDLPCEQASVPTEATIAARVPQYPNRPNPPCAENAWPVFAPFQSSVSRSVNISSGIAFFNNNSGRTRRETLVQNLDVNGDGFPETIRNGKALLTSPVGIPRKDWFRLFRVQGANPGSLGAHVAAEGFRQHWQSQNLEAGVGLSATTAALYKNLGSKDTGTGATEANVNPSGSLSFGSGRDTEFTELMDFNGDGIIDQFRAKSIGDPLALRYGLGSGLHQKLLPGPFATGDGSESGRAFNSNHSAGFGLRLGFSNEAGSFSVGLGMSNRGAGSVAALLDFTGNGRPDVVVPSSGIAKCEIIVFPNLGSGFGRRRCHNIQDFNGNSSAYSETNIVDGGPAFTTGTKLIAIKIVVTAAGKLARNYTRELQRISDLNGDGAPDILLVQGRFKGLGGTLNPDTILDGEPQLTTFYNPTAQVQKLSSITDPTGRVIDLAYELAGNQDPAHGRSAWVLSSVTVDDGFEPELAVPIGETEVLSPDGDDIIHTAFEYSNGIFNRAEQAFYGFEEMVSTTYGCSKTEADKECLINRNPLARSIRSFFNRDFYTQGMVREERSFGWPSDPERKNSIETDEPNLLSINRYAYSIDNLMRRKSQLSSEGLGGSRLDPDWQKDTPRLQNGFLFSFGEIAKNSICENVRNCSTTLDQLVDKRGFLNEDHFFWRQQSAAPRLRFKSQHVFDGRGVASNVPSVSFTNSLSSAIAFDNDQWGNPIRFTEFGEIDASGDHLTASTTHSQISYAPRQAMVVSGPDLTAISQTGRPIIGLADEIKIDGLLQDAEDNDNTILRVREALYSEDGRGNLEGICLYPGGPIRGYEFSFEAGQCARFSKTVDDELTSGYSNLRQAMQQAYQRIPGLPSGSSQFNAVKLFRLSYDQFGNVVHTVSPVSDGMEWTERRFSYDADPLRQIPTRTALTRCVVERTGNGASTENGEDNSASCTFGLTSLPDPVRRRAITHQSSARVDIHHGMIASTKDINAHTVLMDYDQWGRLNLVARDWGDSMAEKPPKVFRDRLIRAEDKIPDDLRLHDRNTAQLFAAVDYQVSGSAPGNQITHKSMITRFDTDITDYAGLSRNGVYARRSVAFSDALSKIIQTQTDAEICQGIDPNIVNNSARLNSGGGLSEYCKGGISRIRVSPSVQTDALGRELAAFEQYSGSLNNTALPTDISKVGLQGSPPPTLPIEDDGAFTNVWPRPIHQSVYDGAGRLLKRRTRLSSDGNSGVAGTAQFRYSILLPTVFPALNSARFQTLRVDTRCAANVSRSDARGLLLSVVEAQNELFLSGKSAGSLSSGTLSESYKRNLKSSRPTCLPVENIYVDPPTNDSSAPAQNPLFNAEVIYEYDQLHQLTSVAYPLEIEPANGSDPITHNIQVRYDDIGRLVEMNEPDSGCTRYTYDGLDNLVSEIAYPFEVKDDYCGTSSDLRNEKYYDYAADRLVEMRYTAPAQTGQSAGARDTVRFYYDRYPHSLENDDQPQAPKYVPNHKANMDFISRTGSICPNCFGQIALVTDRTGARSFGYNELGLPSKEVRSIVAPIVQRRTGESSAEGFLPEVARYRLTRSYTAFGDLLSESYNEDKATNAPVECNKEGGTACETAFEISRRYTPDGGVAKISVNGKEIASSARDALNRPVLRWTPRSTITGFAYSPVDLRLNQMATVSFATGESSKHLPVQINGYQYDGAGNILGYANRAKTNDYLSAFAFSYDGVNRLTAFNSTGSKGKESYTASGIYQYDLGHRFTRRELSVNRVMASEGGGEVAANTFNRIWDYNYVNAPIPMTDNAAPVHAPASVRFSVNDKATIYDLSYDHLGRMTQVEARTGGKAPFPLVSNRAINWDGAGRLTRVTGVSDPIVAFNQDWLRENYIYDSGSNRTIRIHRPRGTAAGAETGKELENVTLYLTPFYARPIEGRGRIQIAANNLPNASVNAPSPTSKLGAVTYYFSDLPVGSVTAAVTQEGPPSEPESLRISRREYSPYGLELTTDTLTNSPLHPPVLSFHGKELDRVTGYSSFGARSYSRDLGVWLSPDPLMTSYIFGGQNVGMNQPGSLSGYAFVENNPVTQHDPDGRKTSYTKRSAKYSGVRPNFSYKQQKQLLKSWKQKGKFQKPGSKTDKQSDSGKAFAQQYSRIDISNRNTRYALSKIWRAITDFFSDIERHEELIGTEGGTQIIRTLSMLDHPILTTEIGFGSDANEALLDAQAWIKNDRLTSSLLPKHSTNETKFYQRVLDPVTGIISSNQIQRDSIENYEGIDGKSLTR